MPPDSSVPLAAVDDEMLTKADQLRESIERHGLGAIRLRGQDWFAWGTCGGSNAVLMATDGGIAEVLATRDGVQVLTDVIEAERLRGEEVPTGVEVVAFEWADDDAADAHALEAAGGGAVASDLPAGEERPLPASLVAAKRRLLDPEIERYRSVGRDAAQALTEAIGRATPDMTEFELAGIGAEALLRRGLDPALILVAGSQRVDRHRHPRPTTSPVGDRVEMVVCGRRGGLFANLTRFAWFREPTESERRTVMDVALVEADALDATRPGATLGAVFAAITAAYARLGYARAELEHHQGGTTGYRSREVLARPGDPTTLDAPLAAAWNPSLAGAKIEDTVLLTDAGLEVLTLDPSWPTVEVAGRTRPDLLVRA